MSQKLMIRGSLKFLFRFYLEWYRCIQDFEKSMTCTITSSHTFFDHVSVKLTVVNSQFWWWKAGMLGSFKSLFLCTVETSTGCIPVYGIECLGVSYGAQIASKVSLFGIKFWFLAYFCSYVFATQRVHELWGSMDIL